METVKSEIRLLAPVEKVWTYFSEPHHVQKWFFAIKDWRCARALNELRAGGKFSYRMENKDGSHGYDFVGTIDSVIPMEKILSTLDDGRNLEFHFEKKDDTTTHFIMFFDPETKNTRESQKRFWDIVLSNFEKYVENSR